MGLYHSPVASSRFLLKFYNYFSKIIILNPGYLILIGKALTMAYIYLYSATSEADLREFTSPLVLQKCYNYYYYHFSLMLFTIIISIVGKVTVVIMVYAICSPHNKSFIFYPLAYDSMGRFLSFVLM